MKKINDHVHKYKRVTLSEKTGYKVFKCQVTGCRRFLKRELLVGEISECWRCGQELILTMENTKLARPTHTECRGGADLSKYVVDDVSDEGIDEFLTNLGI